MVDAQRTFLKPPSAEVGFTYKIEVSKIMVNANVVMDFGETLVLGGLSEKETTHTRDGVPVLQDTPVLQYLFGNKDSNDFQRSVLMLITPRAPQYAFRSDEAIKADPASGGDSESLKELRARYGDWFRPYPTMQSVFHHLNKSSIYREFRTGDVTLEKWDKQETAGERLRAALDFLFCNARWPLARSCFPCSPRRATRNWLPSSRPPRFAPSAICATRASTI